MSDMAGRSWTEVEVSHVIVRACVNCGHARSVGWPCEGCGLAEEPVTHDLGVQSYIHRNPFKRLAWRWFGQRLACRRAREASRYITDTEA